MQENLVNFRKAHDDMIAKNDTAFLDTWDSRTLGRSMRRSYTPEEVQRIIEGTNIEAKLQLSQWFFVNNGIYSSILMHYATLFKYVGILIPTPSFGKNLSNTNIQKRYRKALQFIDKATLQNLCFNFALRALRDGAYYGLLLTANETQLIILDLPAAYCRSNVKDVDGNDVIEFNLAYFDNLGTGKENALKAFPKVFQKAYNAYHKGKIKSKWFIVPTSIGICFTLAGDSAIPMFLNVIPRALSYEEAIDVEKEKELEEIRKIIVQKIPHLNTGDLLFEPVEAVEIHSGTVGMVKGNKNISVLTTYADTDVISSRTSAETKNDFISKTVDLPFLESGTSKELFSPSTSSGLPWSIKNETALMSPLVQKFSNFFTSVLNMLFSNSLVSFKYSILPITWYNEDEYSTRVLSLANSGYSFLLPAIANGLTQLDLCSIKELENEVLKLGELLIPLQTSYTQSAAASGDNGAGAPTKPIEQKEDQTIVQQDNGTK